MNSPSQAKDAVEDPQDIDEREALEQSEKRAAETHPDNYKEEENDSKVVEIGPDLTEAPIEGIDPPERRK